MRELLVVSVAPGGAPAGSGVPHAPAVRLLVQLGQTGTHTFDDGWAAFTGAGDDDRLPASDPGGGFTVRLTRSARGRAADLDIGRLAGLLGDGSRLDGAQLSGLLPPFAAAHRATAHHATVVAGDWLGLRQLFWWQGNGVAAVSTSALALAALTGAGWDVPALQAQSLLGWQVGLATAYAGITKLAPGCAAVLHQGRVAVHRYAPESLAPESPELPVAAVVDEMATILRDFHVRYLADHPETVLQLSGGQDSRLLLCAIPPEQRRGLRALTLDVHGGAEARVASRLRDACGLRHELHWLDERPPLDPSTGHQVAVEAAGRLSGLASPLALGPLTVIEADLEQGRRLSGTGGETARGFYYPGQPRAATTSGRLVRRLADWRLFTNEAVEPEALDPDFAAGARPAALDAVASCFDRLHSDWLRATDEFYLWHRVQRWAGAHDTPAAVDRHNLNPLLDRRFLQLALAPPPAQKRQSRLTGRLIHRLSPELAAIPLDTGLAPVQLARRGPVASAALARATGRKAARKLVQRVRGGRRLQLGAADLAALVVTRWRAQPDLVTPVRRTGLVRDGWLDELLGGRREALPTTVAFLVNLLVLAEATGARTPDGDLARTI